MCDEYLINFHKTDLEKILDDEDVTKHFSININFIVLYEHQAAIAIELLKAPEKCLEEWDTSTVKAQLVLLKRAREHATLKIHVHCRIYQLPGLSEVCRTIFPRNDDADKFLQVSGTVMRMSASKLLEYQRVYICVKCKYSTVIKAEYDRKYIIKQPKKCKNPEECSGTNLIAFGELDSDNCKDYQEIKIQEEVKKLGLGCMPNTMCVTLEDDLVDSCKPGDSVTICGVVKRRWGEFSKGCKIDIDIVLKANNVQVNNNSSSTVAATPEIQHMFTAFWKKYSGNSLTGRDLILKSFCPQIYGLYLVKLAIAVVLAGGSRIDDSGLTGVRTRSESHLLLVGDPGTGKSHLLRFASKIIPRSVLTTGVGSTAAGLTVTAVMERGEWHLEGGALVLSDGGICCIDEFNSMKEHDRTSIHEAMEQQTISVAKASIVCKLNTRCSILAACNPKGNLDVSQPLCMNVALPSPLLSRFDLILLLRDAVNEEWDTQIVDYILNCGNRYSKLTESSLWNVDILQSYFAIVRKLNPKLSEDAERILSEYYQMQRRIDSRNKARTTVRLLESLVRLSQGHARLMYHDTVETMDSIYAIALVDAAMDSDSSILDLNITAYSVFPEYPSRDYRGMLQAVLTKLGLQDILEKELAILKSIEGSGWSENLKSRFFNRFGEGNEDPGEKIDIPAAVRSAENEGNKRPRSPEVRDGVKKIKNVEPLDMPSTSSRTAEGYECREMTLNKNDNIMVKNSADGGSKDVKIMKKIAKKAKKGFCATDNVLDLDFDDGYDTLSFGASNSTKDQCNKSTAKSTMKKIPVRKSKDDLFQVTSESSSDFVGINLDSKPIEIHIEYKTEIHSLGPNKTNIFSLPTSVQEEVTLKTVADGAKQSTSSRIAEEFDSTEVTLNENDKTMVKESADGGGKEVKIMKKVNKKPKKGFWVKDDDLDLEFDEGYDTLSFGVSNSAKDQCNKSTAKSTVKKRVSVTKSKIKSKDDLPQETSESSSNFDLDADVIFNSKPTETNVEKDHHPLEPPNRSNEFFSIATNVEEEVTLKTVGAKQSSIKNKFKKFKFVPKDIPDNQVDVALDCNDAKVDNDTEKMGEEDIVQEETELDEADDYIKEDLKMLKMFPSVNDDLNVDLDFDWDNLESANSVLNNKSKKKIKLVKSSSASVSSMSRSNSSSSQLSKRNIFASDENVDDLDLDI